MTVLRICIMYVYTYTYVHCGILLSVKLDMFVLRFYHDMLAVLTHCDTTTNKGE